MVTREEGMASPGVEIGMNKGGGRVVPTWHQFQGVLPHLPRNRHERGG